MQKLKSKRKLLKLICGGQSAVVPIPLYLYHLSLILDELAALPDYDATGAFEDAYGYLMAEYTKIAAEQLSLPEPNHLIAVCRKITSAETAEKIVEKIEIQKL